MLDTNFLVSATLKQKSTPGMAVLLVERRHVLLKSPATEEQLFAVVDRPHFDSWINADTRAWLTKLVADADPVTVTERMRRGAIPRMTHSRNWR